MSRWSSIDAGVAGQAAGKSLVGDPLINAHGYSWNQNGRVQTTLVRLLRRVQPSGSLDQYGRMDDALQLVITFLVHADASLGGDDVARFVAEVLANMRGDISMKT